MELIIKSVLLAISSYFPFLIEILLNRKSAECMQGSNKDETPIFIANKNEIENMPYRIVKDESIKSEPVLDYHNEVGISSLYKLKTYTDVEKLDEICNLRSDGVDKASAFVIGSSAVIGSKYLTKPINTLMSASIGSFHNLLYKEHIREDLGQMKWDSEMRKKAFLASKEKMGVDSYNNKLNDFVESRDISKEELIRYDESLENKFDFCEKIINSKDENLE